MVWLVKTDGKVENVTLARGKRFSCEELEKLVGGPLEELVTKREIIYYNKKGKELLCPLNGKATVAVNLKYPFIEEVYGNVVIIDRKGK